MLENRIGVLEGRVSNLEPDVVWGESRENGDGWGDFSGWGEVGIAPDVDSGSGSESSGDDSNY